jgi:large subunit ribosomal protein L25
MYINQGFSEKKTMSLTIECKKRPEGSNPKALRREGLIPANIYGHDGDRSISLVVDAKEAVNLLKEAKVSETPVEVSIPELSWKGKAVVQEVQAHPWKRNLYHISFFSKGS